MGNPYPGAWRLVSRMTPGELRTATRLEQKLDDDYPSFYPLRMLRHGEHYARLSAVICWTGRTKSGMS